MQIIIGPTPDNLRWLVRAYLRINLTIWNGFKSALHNHLWFVAFIWSVAWTTFVILRVLGRDHGH